MAKKNRTVIGLQEMLAFYLNSGVGNKLYYNYVCHIENLCQKVNGHSIADWINQEMSSNSTDPIDNLEKHINTLLLSAPLSWTPKTKSNYKSGFIKFIHVVLGLFYGNIWLNVGNYNKLFCDLIAANTLFAAYDVVKDVINGKLGTQFNINTKKSQSGYNNPFASWDYMDHFRNNQLPKNTKVPDPTFPALFPGAHPYKVADDNTYANQYIKKAIIESFERKYNTHFSGVSYTWFKNYEACHVWDFPDDRCYYASIANLVLVPRALAQLTDHNNAVKELLRYEVYKRFRFYPKTKNITPPNKPKYYPKVWRQL